MASNDTAMKEAIVVGGGSAMNSPSIHVTVPTGTKMLRSPSRESVATELSVCSIASFHFGGGHRGAADGRHLTQQLSGLTPNRGPSPVPGRSGHFLKVPGVGGGGPSTPIYAEVWCEEETDLNVIKSCSTLSTALGLPKSFSTGDILLACADAANEVNDPYQGRPSIDRSVECSFPSRRPFETWSLAAPSISRPSPRTSARWPCLTRRLLVP